MAVFYWSEMKQNNSKLILPRKYTSSSWPPYTLLVVVVFLCGLQTIGAQHSCGGIKNRFVCDRNNPTLFHICLGSSRYTMVCPDSLHFNVNTQKCDWPGVATCAMKPVAQQSASPYVAMMSREREQDPSARTGYTQLPTGLGTVFENDSETSKQRSGVNTMNASIMKHRGQSVKQHTQTDEQRPSPEGPRYKKTQPDTDNNSRKRDSTSYPESRPSEITSLHANTTEPHVDEYGRLQDGPHNLASKISPLPDTRTRVKDAESIVTSDSSQKVWQSNKIPETNSVHHKAGILGPDSWRTFQSDTSVTTRTPDPRSTAYPHRSTHGSFTPRLSHHKPTPEMYSVRTSPYRHSSWSSRFRSPHNSLRHQAAGLHRLQSGDLSRADNSNTDRQLPATKQSLKPTQKTDTSKRRTGISLVKPSWWNHGRPEASQPSQNSPRTYLHRWHNMADHEDLKDSSVVSHLKSRTEPKAIKRPYKRKYKPRNHIPKPNYQTRTVQGNEQTGGMRSTPQVSIVRQQTQPLKAAASRVAGKSARAPGVAHGKFSINAAAASSDIKAAVYQSDNFVEVSNTDPATNDSGVATEEDPKDKEIAAYKSPIEKYSAKPGRCSSSWCKLPACRCVGPDIPGGLEVTEVPQIVMLTFDDSINIQNIHFYKELFNGSFKNPNGCPIKSTFFVSGDNSDYMMVRTLVKQGHEMASHTLSHRSPTTWWADAGFDNWEQEVVGMKHQLQDKAGVKAKDVAGMRAPFLQVGGDGQYAMLKENKFRYDSSMVTGHLFSNNQPPVWPFTLDTPPDSTTCNISPCPTRSYPGLWEVPLVRWYGSNLIACAMPDACTIDSGSKSVYKFMDVNFNRHYNTNRAPFGIFIHASWFSRVDGVFEGLKDFLRSLADREDVWVVTVSQALDWVQHPVRLSALSALESWAC